jgi:hypothetical protein
VKQYECVVMKNDTQLFSLLEIGIPKYGLEDVLYRFNDMQGIQADRM